MAKAKRKNKYGAVKCYFDGFKFDSRKEYKRYTELKLLQKAGTISGLNVHPSWPLPVKGVLIGKYTADFIYLDIKEHRIVVEDVKSPITARTEAFRLRMKLMKAIYHIEVVIV